MRNKLTDELALCGLNAVTAAARNSGQINRLFLREDRLPEFRGLCKELAARKRPYKICPDEELERIGKSRAHQGIVAMIFEPKIQAAAVEDLEKWGREGAIVLVPHDIGNDHNIGAIVRSAAYFGIHDIVLGGLRSGDKPLTTAAYRVAEGGMEHVVFRGVQNTAAFLAAARAHLTTIGAVTTADLCVGDVIPGRKAGCAVVLGNEETGLPPDVRAACAHLVRIPGAGLIDSLNVSAAAAIFLRELRRA
jgi:TrmH RNA methyltransferase